MAERLGAYELRGELGRGAMAVVWRAYDLKLEREVAIKEPVIGHGTTPPVAEELAARFVREGKAAARLNHPGIVTIHAADVFDGRPAIVMELIEGETLSAVLDRGPLEIESAIAVLDQLLDATAYAHERGVVHRDIKPDNVFVTPDGRVKLADFGIAHVGDSATLKTQAGTVMGTPGYMAPEQVTGQPVDARTDVFAIGAIAHEMLGGRNPFGTADGASPTTVMYRIVHEQSAPLPADIAAPLSTAVRKALAKDPARRYQSAAEFRTALRATATSPPGTSDRHSTPRTKPGGLASRTASTWARPLRRTNATVIYTVAGISVLLLGLLFVLSGQSSFSVGGTAQGGTGTESAATRAGSGANEAASPSPSLLTGADWLAARDEIKRYLDSQEAVSRDAVWRPEALRIVGLALAGSQADAWATARVVPEKDLDLGLDPASVILHRTGDSAWEVVTLGTSVGDAETQIPQDLRGDLLPVGEGRLAKQRRGRLTPSELSAAQKTAKRLQDAIIKGDRSLGQPLMTEWAISQARSGDSSVIHWNPANTPEGYPSSGKWLATIDEQDPDPTKDGFWLTVWTREGNPESGGYFTHGATAMEMVEQDGKWFCDDEYHCDPGME
jgi:serine/threonine protein kinase